MKLMLERGLPPGAPVEALRARGRDRHGRILQSVGAIAGVVDFPVQGSSNPFTVGLYYTRVQLGNPPKESSSGDVVACIGGFCSEMYGDTSVCGTNDPYMFKITYGDGSVTSGYLVSDFLQYDRVMGNHQTAATNGAVTFG